jgi:hypothetical protein
MVVEIFREFFFFKLGGCDFMLKMGGFLGGFGGN